MGIEIAKDDSVIVGVEELLKIWSVFGGTRGVREEVYIDNVGWGTVEVCLDSIYFEDVVG